MDLLFLYGHLLNIGDVIAHGGIPSDLEPVGPALLPDQELCVIGRPPRGIGGVLTIRRAVASAVEGFLFRASERGLACLDRLERLDSGDCRRRALPAVTPDGLWCSAWVYEITKADPSSLRHARALESARLGARVVGLQTDALERAVSGAPFPSAIDTLFVYGTLMRGESRHHLMRPERSSRVQDVSRPAELRDGGDYPFLVVRRDAKRSVRGELWHFPPGQIPLAELDRYEDFRGYDAPGGSLFHRTVVRAVSSSGAHVAAWAYTSPAERPDLPLIESGDWRRKLPQA